LTEISFKIEGLDELEKQLEELPEKAAKQIMRRSLKEAAGIWRGEMIAHVIRGWHVWGAVITGKKRGKGGERLQRQGFTNVREFGVVSRLIGFSTKISPDGLAGAIAVGPNKKAFWATFMEFGTSHQKAFPFARPAFEAKKADVVATFIESVKHRLEEVGFVSKK
jgi:HK97 gp10 family phage protein